MDNNEVVTEEVAAVVENNTGIEIEPLFEEQVDFDTFSKSDFRVVKVKNYLNLMPQIVADRLWRKFQRLLKSKQRLSTMPLYEITYKILLLFD